MIHYCCIEYCVSEVASLPNTKRLVISIIVDASETIVGGVSNLLLLLLLLLSSSIELSSTLLFVSLLLLLLLLMIPEKEDCGFDVAAMLLLLFLWGRKEGFHRIGRVGSTTIPMIATHDSSIAVFIRSGLCWNCHDRLKGLCVYAGSQYDGLLLASRKG